MNKKPVILHIEDDVDVQEICKMSIELFDEFEIRQCCCGEEALYVAADFTADILLLDVMMPGMNGEVLLKKLRDLPNYAKTPAIFMTARAQESEKAALLKAGSIAVIIKPFDPMTLSHQIRDALAIR